jgi:(2Fe-2S) ferredoxin
MIYAIHLFVCTNQRSGTERLSCGEQHGLSLVTEFKRLTKNSPGLSIRVNRSGCLGICDFGPTVAIYPEGTFYVGVTVADVEEIVSSHIFNGKPVERLLLKK